MSGLEVKKLHEHLADDLFLHLSQHFHEEKEKYQANWKALDKYLNISHSRISLEGPY